MIGLDIDGEAGRALLLELSGGDLPPTLEFTTGGGGGERMLYALPPGIELPIRSFKAGDKTEAVRILSTGS